MAAANLITSVFFERVLISAFSAYIMNNNFASSCKGPLDWN
ncbi:hypothetical protein [Paenibacillus fonticola]|nr:hypothetical protein [Paenibacillus fonticola]